MKAIAAVTISAAIGLGTTTTPSSSPTTMSPGSTSLLRKEALPTGRTGYALGHARPDASAGSAPAAGDAQRAQSPLE